MSSVKSPKAVTLDDIATAAGVSRDTVSRIINRNATYQKPALARRAARIRRMAQKLGYRPNAAARAARSGRFQRIGLILPYGRASYIPYGLLTNLTHTLAEENYQLAVSELPRPEAESERLPHLLRELSIDGLVTLIDPPDDQVRHMLAELRIPMVWVNEKLPTNCVYPDEIDAGFRLTEYLLSLGHRRIAFVDLVNQWQDAHVPADYEDQPGVPPPRRVLEKLHEPSRDQHYSTADRREGYARAMHRAGLEPHAPVISGRSYVEQQAGVTELLRCSDRPTAVVMARESPAAQLFPAAAAVGLSVPDDLSIASFTWGGGLTGRFGLTGIIHGAEWLSQKAFDVLKQQIEQPHREVPARTIFGRLLIDRSTAPPGEAFSSSTR